MLVTRTTFDFAVHTLQSRKVLAADTETTGLRAYHGDMLFSVVFHDGTAGWYFNFNQYEDCDADDERYLDPAVYLPKLKPVFAKPRVWRMHNAKFDLAMLAREGIDVAGEIHCTMALERVRYNDLHDYSLAGSGKRIGYEKDATVEQYITQHGLKTPQVFPGKTLKPRLHYDRVPLALIVNYALIDAKITYKLGDEQEAAFQREDASRMAGWPRIAAVVANEKALTPTLFAMEKLGVRVDLDFCRRAIEHEKARHIAERARFKELTGFDFKKSGTLFQKVFADEQDKWGRTNPKKNKSGKSGISFDKKSVLSRFENPAAKCVIAIGETKTNIDYFTGFLYHADASGRLHPNFNQAGANTGRLSCTQPNMQNLKKPDEDDDEDTSGLGEFQVRRAIVPEDGNVFMMFDYDQLQYRLMLDYAGAMDLIRKVRDEGLDVHQAMADYVGITRYQAKTTNFSILFGAGIALLAKNLKLSQLEARTIKDRVFRAAPEIETFVNRATDKARARKFVFSWLGRRYDMPIYDFAYMAVNKIIQGGEAEMMKIAINRVHEFLLPYKTRLVLTVHDELVTEGPPDEARILGPKIKEILEGIYPYRHLPMTAAASYSFKSLADKEKGYVP